MTTSLRFPDAPEQRPVIVAGARTPWIKSGTAFKKSSAADLGVQVVREVLARAELHSADVDEVVLGCVGPLAKEANIARVVALRAGIPAETPAFTVQRNCASGFQAIEDAARRIVTGEGSVYVVGGTECMSSYPLMFGDRMTALFERMFKSRSFMQRVKTLLSFRLSMLKPRIALVEGLTDPTCGMIMGLTAEKLANEWGISRDEQDRFALESHRRASRAWEAGAFADEVLDVFLAPDGTAVSADNGPRKDQSLEQLGKLRPFFDRHEGTVTVGNACPVTDGAVALLMMSEAEAKRRGLAIRGKLVSSAVVGLDPSIMGLGPALAAPAALRAAGCTSKDVDLWEINEAFAAQAIACQKALDSNDFGRNQLGLDGAFGAPDPAKLNRRGGAIALGHPIGATGARLVLTAIDQLRESGGLSVTTACVGGGQGAAQVWEVAA
ncbi:MAG: acetyl-CoA C-acyltransferase [Planctomycetes bacterium]|jgi:acetyl-CoA C-acetyltransferase/acetyl-CoA acyltransferase|nr:acetyl-CoA C-acyltransferase [Planctomycetota bacterium]MDP6423566.1 acetyl-CoA C-acyltransferase [Planctomycetota bacterium]